MLPVAILAGGTAMPMRPMTEKIPKALIEVAGQPFVVWRLRYLRDQGIGRIVLCLVYPGAQIERLIGDGGSIGLEIRYCYDGPVLLRTGGALKRALPLLGDRFFAPYGDTFLSVQYGPIERAFFGSGKPALMTVFKNERRFDTSNAIFCNGLVEYDKKSPRPEMSYIDYGLGVLTASLFDAYALNEPLAEIYNRLSLAGDLAGYEVHERFYEVGSPAGLRDTQRYFQHYGYRA